MEETVQLVDLFCLVNDLKKVLRYEEGNRREKFNGDSTAEHSWRVTFMVVRVIDQYKLPVDKMLSADMAVVHDILELITKDTPARLIKKKPWLKQQKHMQELLALERICKVIPEPFRNKFCELTNEYWSGIIPEAVLVKAIDKNESTLHIISNSTEEMVCDGFFPIYGKNEILKAVEIFPQLRPFFMEVRKRVRQEVEKYGGKWMKKFDYLKNGGS